MDCVTVESGCNNELSNNGFAFQQEECHAHRDKLQLHCNTGAPIRDRWKPTDKRTHCSMKVQVLLCRHRQISEGLKVVTMARRLAAQEHSCCATFSWRRASLQS